MRAAELHEATQEVVVFAASLSICCTDDLQLHIILFNLRQRTKTRHHNDFSELYYNIFGRKKIVLNIFYREFLYMIIFV